MKNLLSILLLVSSLTSFAQPIIINSTDIPIPAGPFNNVNYSLPNPPAPSLGDNQSWDYSSYNGTIAAPNNMIPETDPFFTNAGIDVYRQEFKDLNYTAGYYVIAKYDFNANSVSQSGIEIPYQGYDLSGVTGSTQDSIVFPAQKYLNSNPSPIMQFPFTANSSWHSVSRRSNDFELSVSSFGLSHAPGQHAYWNYRNDSIVGWGKLRVYTTSGPSIWYDVLMDKYEEYTLDSFYLNGSPAPVLLMNAFTVTQGQKTNANYGYNFYRTGSFNYLVRFDYATDSTYSFVLGAYQNIDNILGTSDVSGLSYSTVVFPNPVADVVNIRIMGRHFQSNDYEISDITGKIVQKGLINFINETICIRLINIANGTYMVAIKDIDGNKIVSEEVVIKQ